LRQKYEEQRKIEEELKKKNLDNIESEEITQEGMSRHSKLVKTT
jgi:hypothetical protein